MSKMILVCGPQAVGKMTVGEKIAEKTNLKFMHNHETIDLPLRIFGYESQSRRKLTELFRNSIFEEVAKSNEVEGIVFTFIWAFNYKGDWDYVNKIKELFEKNDGEFYVVELEADLEERLKRNVSEYRLSKKPTKRDTEHSKRDLLESMKKYRMNSEEGEVPFENYIKINNTNLSADEVADIVVKEFKFNKWK